MNTTINNNSQSTDLLSVNPSGDLKNITLYWCESDLIIERTSDTKVCCFVFNRLRFIPVLAVLLLCCISQCVYIYL